MLFVVLSVTPCKLKKCFTPFKVRFNILGENLGGVYSIYRYIISLSSKVIRFTIYLFFLTLLTEICSNK